MTRWIDPEPVDIEPLAGLDAPRLVAQILVRRGLRDPAAAKAFLAPRSIPSTPFPGIETAVDRLLYAIRHGQPICVWGDFDVDGQTSTALLVQTLRGLDAQVSHYIPTRGKEGHGVHVASLEPIMRGGAKVILTCDTGISAGEAVAFGEARGVDFVITDHHDIVGDLPNAHSVINPKLLPRGHALASLAGVGVAYKLAEALCGATHSTVPAVLDLVALGLIADMALLTGETRALACRGIQALRETDRLGLLVLAERTETNLISLTEETIGFSLAPRLNAAGRLDDANAGFELLLTQDRVRASVLAAQIEALNVRRRLLTDQVDQAAEDQLHADSSLLERPILILTHPLWPGGVLGIVAARLVERYRKPTLLLSASDDAHLRGSARSIEGLDITKAIAVNQEHLLNFGGHPMAAGLSLEASRLPQFRRGMEGTVERMLDLSGAPEDALQIDEWVDLGSLSNELADEVEQLAPFGAGNPIPIFGTRGLTLQSSRAFGSSGEHRRMVVADGLGGSREVVWWNTGDVPMPSGRFDCAYSVRASSFHGEPCISVQWRDWRLLNDAPIQIAVPQLEIVDLRDAPSSGRLPPTCLIWAEGADSGRGADRFHLHESAEFAIVTSPPGRTELHDALAVVQPRKVYLLARSSTGIDTVRDFLGRLAGLSKYALSHHDGQTTISRLAAACAQRQLTVRLGLEWLAAGGNIDLVVDGDTVQVSPGNVTASESLMRELYAGVRSSIEETTAYRAHFATADPRAVLKWQ